MSDGRILVVEDDFDISNMLRIYFSGQGYQVQVAARGSAALEACRTRLPDLIILDIMLPDMDGYAICRELRTTTRTSHIPIIFLTQKDERSDKIAGLELGADDYITKPFDIEELKLRVKNAINTHRRLNQTDPKTGLPSGKLIEDQLRKLMRRDNWHLLLIGVEHLDPFHQVYGFVAGDEVLRFMAMLLNDAVEAYGSADDFIGHPGNDTFLVISFGREVPAMVEKIRADFSAGIKAHYNFMDSDRGGIEMLDGTVAPIMRLSIGLVSDKTERFSDIREITELAADFRRADQG